MGRMGALQIGDVAQRAGVPAPTIRYYEEIGVLVAPARSPTGYRRYSESVVDELRFIRKAQALGFSLDEIREILMLSRSGRTPCQHVLSLWHQHLAAVDERIRQLQQFREQFAAELAKWDGETTPTCRGLCQIIASADAGGAVESIDLTPRRRTQKADEVVRRDSTRPGPARDRRNRSAS